MKIRALTTDGTWWIIHDEGYLGVLDREEFFKCWLGVTSDSFFHTNDDHYIQKCNIVAIKFED